MITHDPEDGRPLCVFTYYKRYKRAAGFSHPRSDRIRRRFYFKNSIDSGAFRPSDNRIRNPWNVVRVAGSLITHSGERHFDNPVFLHADGRRMLLFSNLKKEQKARHERKALEYRAYLPKDYKKDILAILADGVEPSHRTRQRQTTRRTMSVTKNLLRRKKIR